MLAAALLPQVLPRRECGANHWQGCSIQVRAGSPAITSSVRGGRKTALDSWPSRRSTITAGPPRLSDTMAPVKAECVSGRQGSGSSRMRARSRAHVLWRKWAAWLPCSAGEGERRHTGWEAWLLQRGRSPTCGEMPTPQAYSFTVSWSMATAPGSWQMRSAMRRAWGGMGCSGAPTPRVCEGGAACSRAVVGQGGGCGQLASLALGCKAAAHAALRMGHGAEPGTLLADSQLTWTPTQPPPHSRTDVQSAARAVAPASASAAVPQPLPAALTPPPRSQTRQSW